MKKNKAVDTDINKNETKQQGAPRTVNKKEPNKKLIKRIVILIVIVIILLFAASCYFISKLGPTLSTLASGKFTEYTVERMDICSEIEASGVISPLNEYNITTLIKGDIIKADFEVGDLVSKNDVLYQISTEDVDLLIDSAKTTLTRAEENYILAQKAYDKAVSRLEREEEHYADAESDYAKAKKKYDNAVTVYSDFTVKAPVGGTVTKVYVNKGDKISEGSNVVEVMDLSKMMLEVPFNMEVAKQSWVGKSAQVEVVGSMEELKGTVKRVSTGTKVLAGNKLVRMVTIEVINPGGITTESSGIATIGKHTCGTEGIFSAGTIETITSDKAGKVASVDVYNGSLLNKDDLLLTIDGNDKEELLSPYTSALDTAKQILDSRYLSLESAKDAVESASLNVKSAINSVEDAKKNLANQEKALEDCMIKTPITGKVIKKNMLVGDIIGASDINNTMAVIYDLSTLKFDMAIDELDIISLKVGQKVNISVEALDDVFTGTITNISMVSTNNTGVTNYPVTVRIDDIGNLIPGMNVTGTIALDTVTAALAVPVDAVLRDEIVYVKDTAGIREQDDKAPAGYRTVTVKTGICDGKFIEITEGLSEGDIIYVKRFSSETNTTISDDGSVTIVEE